MEIKQCLLLLSGDKDAKALHDRLLSAGVLSDPLSDTTPALRHLFSQKDFRPESVEAAFRGALGSTYTAEAPNGMLAMHLITELIISQKDEPGSWSHRLLPAEPLLLHFWKKPCSSCCEKATATKVPWVDAALRALLSCLHLTGEDQGASELLRALCDMLGIAAADLRSWSQDPVHALQKSERFIAVVNDVCCSLQHAEQLNAAEG